MAFTDIELKRHYTTYKNNIVKEFYIPVLRESVLYQRSVGFFSSTALIELTKGLQGLIKNNGKIQFIVSPYLQPEDVEAMNKGYERKKIIEKALLREIKEPEDYFQEERLNLLAHLIEEGNLEIKVAFTPLQKPTGMYHEKVGLLMDKDGNKIVFVGSMNETINAFYNNFESIVVFKTWEESKKYAEDIQKDFELLWNNKSEGIEIIDFPDVLKERIKAYKKKKVFEFEDIDEEELKTETIIKIGIPSKPKGFKMREYQEEAIREWKNNGYKGIFDMATGTGKTYTGLGAIVDLYENKKRLAIIIVCPYQHLVEQWVEDIELFNMDPIIGYSSSKQKNWKKLLEDDVMDFNIGVIDCFCFVTTNATYSSKFVSDIMKKLGQDTLLLVDEAHNFGSLTLREKLYSNIEYRLALSATLERYGDVEGTECLKKYFGKKCIEYDLKRAIKEGKLTPYYYYPICIYLNEDELIQYKDLSYRIEKEFYYDKKKEKKITEKGKYLMIQRSRIIAGAKGKMVELHKLFEKYKTESHMLIYCGATRVKDFEQDISEKDEYGERQIVLVSQMLGHEFGMKVTHFTSNESIEEREDIKRRFSTVDPYQAIVAIKCLDEGVNIPSIKTAFILASTTNPKEYIQRRGRVLRTSENKPYACIYDFVTLMHPLDEVDAYRSDYNCGMSLAKRELVRIKEFGEISLNSRDSDELINNIKSAYKINDYEWEAEENGTEFR